MKVFETSVHSKTFPSCSRKDIQKLLKDFIHRHKIALDVESTVEEMQIATEIDNKSLSEELDNIIKDSLTPTSSSSSYMTKKPTKDCEIPNFLNNKMKIWVECDTRDGLLENVYDLLLCVSPTTIESERAFSVAGIFVNKRRTRLDDKTLDCLCFLKAFFINEREENTIKVNSC